MAERAPLLGCQPIETVYAVQGSTGEYSDRTEWIVCAYADESMAREHSEAAQREARSIEAVFWIDHEHNRIDRMEAACKASVFDPGMQVDYTGTSYTVLKVEIRTSLPVPPNTSETEGAP